MTIEVILYTGKKYSNGEYPVMLKLTHKGQRLIKSISKGLTGKKSEWNKNRTKLKTVKESDPNYQRFLEMNTLINDILLKYSNEMKVLAARKQEISVKGLWNRVENPIQNMSVFNYFDRVINQEGTGKYGHSKTFKTCLQRLQGFVKSREYEGDPDPSFHDINLRWLNDFRDYLKKSRKLKDTTTSIYFRSLRDVFNRAIGEEYCDPKDYPFGKKRDTKKFTISQFKTKTKKRAISQEDIQKIKNFDLSDMKQINRTDKYGKPIRSIYWEDIELAQRLFMFSYYAIGMNFHDMAVLKWEDIKDNLISYARKKNGKEMEIELHPYNKEVLELQKLLTGGSADDYVFPILNMTHDTAAKINGRIHRQMRLVNDSLKYIQKQTGIKTPLTTYVSRHSAITHMIENKTRMDIVQQNAGHSDIGTTMIYAKAASRKEKAKAINSLK